MASITIYNMGYAIQVDSLSAAGIGLGTISGITTANANTNNQFQTGAYTNNVNLWADLGVVINDPINAGYGQVSLRSGAFVGLRSTRRLGDCRRTAWPRRHRTLLRVFKKPDLP